MIEPAFGTPRHVVMYYNQRVLAPQRELFEWRVA